MYTNGSVSCVMINV